MYVLGAPTLRALGQARIGMDWASRMAVEWLAAVKQLPEGSSVTFLITTVVRNTVVLPNSASSCGNSSTLLALLAVLRDLRQKMHAKPVRTSSQKCPIDTPIRLYPTHYHHPISFKCLFRARSENQGKLK